MSPSSAQTPKQLIQSLYDAFSRGDIAAVLSGLAANVEWVDEGPPVVPFGGTYRGVAEVATFFQKLDATVAFEEFTVDAAVAEGERVVMLGHFRSRAKTTGKIASSDFAHSWIVREGKAVRFQAFGDTAAVAASFTP
jgi:ketosteroid isomerase-like protein